MQLQKSISLDYKIWEQIDILREAIPRSRFVAKIIAERLKNSEENPK